MANPSVVVDFVANTAKLSAGIKQLGGATGQAAGEVKKVDWKRIALWSGAAVAVGAAAKFVKDAADQTTQLAKNTLALQRVTGMDTRTASQWVEVLKSRGIEVDTFNRSMVLLSKQMTAASDGSAKSAAYFKELGVSMDAVKRGDTQTVLLQAADGLSKMTNYSRRAAITQALFGRSSAKLTPLLYSGSKAIQEQLDMAHKYGAELGDKTTGQVKDMAANQREMGIAMDGVKVKLGTALIPVLLELSKILVDITRVMQPVISNSTVLKITLGVLAAGMIAFKIATLAATIAQLGLDAAMLPTIGIVAAVVVGIVALIAIGVLLYKNWDKISHGLTVAWDAIKSAAMSVLGWLKANWPLILGIIAGPLGLAIALVVTRWGTIKRATTDAWRAIQGVVQGVVNSIKSHLAGLAAWVAGPIGTIHAWLSKLAGWLHLPAEAAHAAVAAIKSAFSGLASSLAGTVATIHNIAERVANAIRAPINAVIGAWNGLAFHFPTVTVPKFAGVKVGGKQVVPGFGGETIGGGTFPFPKIPRLASGGVFSVPTLAMVGEGAGREVVAPEALLRQIVSSMAPVVHVYIGDRELTDLVRVEVVAGENRTAAQLLGGTA